MKRRNLFVGITAFIGIIGMILPVKIRSNDYTNWPMNIGGGPEPEVEYISGLELEFPFLVPFPIIMIGLTLLLILAKSKAPIIIALVLSVINGFYMALTYIVIVLEFFAEAHVGLGYIFMAAASLMMFVWSIAYLVRPHFKLKNDNSILIDDF